MVKEGDRFTNYNGTLQIFFMITTFTSSKVFKFEQWIINKSWADIMEEETMKPVEQQLRTPDAYITSPPQSKKRRLKPRTLLHIEITPEPVCLPLAFKSEKPLALHVDENTPTLIVLKPKGPVPLVLDAKTRQARRLKQIMIGKATDEYKYYLQTISKNGSIPYLMTPRHDVSVSRRDFKRQVHIWRCSLYKFSPR
jgi:hypothetical protein